MRFTEVDIPPQNSASNKVETSYGLSPLQEGMLFHALQTPHAGIYVEQFICQLRQPFSAELLRKAWQTAVQRHATLRTAFDWETQENPQQIVFRQVDLPWVEEDLRPLSRDAQQELLDQKLAADRQLGFDITKPPLTRFAVRRLSDEKYHFTWTFHHLLLDGWSASMVLREVLLIYRSLGENRKPDLPAPVPFSRYVDWLSTQDVEKARAFWTKHLQGVGEPLRLPSPYKKNNFSAEEEYRTYSFHISSNDEVKRFTKLHRLTLSTAAHGAWALLLSKYTGAGDVVFGSVVSCRPPAVENSDSIVGMMINTIPVRIAVQRDLSLVKWLQQLQAEMSEARQYEYCGIAQIQRWAQIPATQPLFETFVLVENFPSLSAMVGAKPDESMTVDERPRTIEKTSFPLGIEVEPDNGITVRIHYNRNRFDDGFVEQMAWHCSGCFEAILAQTTSRIGELRLLTSAEQEQLKRWARGRDVGSEMLPIFKVFENLVVRTPEALAIFDGERQCSYRELNERANQLARYLNSVGIGREMRVGILLERSLETAVALLGILKSGAAYVPLDVSSPRERLGFVTKDAGLAAIVTASQFSQRLEESNIKLVFLDGEETRREMANQLTANPEKSVSAQNLAYVIYTSGSTGSPKAVTIPHTAVMNVLGCLRERLEFGGNDRMLWSTTLTFDIAALEIFLPLLSGGTLLIGGDMKEMASGNSKDVLERLDPTVIQMTPVGWRMLLDSGWRPSSSMKVLCGGELLDPELAEKFILAGCRVWNMYGPTETTIWSAGAPVNDVVSASSIGDPVWNTQVYVLDEDLDPVPIGVAGEIFLGGEGLGRGYHNQPRLTAEKFIPNHFSSSPGERLYRTGDVGRWTQNGKVEFLGRSDHQTKIRGFRIELGEIESVLRKHPAIEQAVVTVREDKPNEKLLVGYVVARNPAAALNHTELRNYLQPKLPDYMIPGSFVWLPALPTTRNGKIDRKQLPIPERRQTGEGTRPRTEIEQLVAGIWEQVLEVDGIGRDENFFELGGHSLTATQVISRLRKSFGLDVPFQLLFGQPTIAGLARALENLQRPVQTVTGPSLAPFNRESKPLPLSYAQQRLWFLHQLEPENTAYNLPSAVRIHGPLDVRALEQSFREVIRRHEVLRTRFVTIDGEPFQDVNAKPEWFTVKLFDLSGREDKDLEVKQRAATEAKRAFNLSRWPLLRAQLLRLSDNEHVLLFTMHHIVGDAWSMAVLTRELGALYEAFSQAKPSPLAELPIQYADFAIWQRQWLTGEVLDEQAGYWKRQLAESPVLELVTDHPRPAVPTHSASTARTTFTPDLTAQLKEFGRRHGATLFMTLLTGYQILLARHTGQWDVAVGSPVANRNREDIEGLIGFFVNTLVLRSQMSPNQSFPELLMHVRKNALEAYAHQDLPFERLVEIIDPQRNLGRSPLFQVRFTMLNTIPAAFPAGNLQLAPEVMETGTAPDDLGLYAEETQNGIEITLEYNTDIFLPATIQRVLGHFEQLLKSAVSTPEQHASELPLLAETERRQVLVEWNQTSEDRGQPRCIHELFAQQVEKTPDAIAVVGENEQLTYGELDEKANRLAHYLLLQGVKPETPVGICLDRSPALIVTILGVLKAGGAYLPLDSGYPPERLAQMLENARAPFVVTEQRLINRLPSGWYQAICLDSESEQIASQSGEPPASGSDPANLAYVIYTSGSTGEPKGVMIQHWGIFNLAKAMARRYEVNSSSRILLFASTSFDASVSEWATALLNGAALVVAKPTSLLAGKELEEVIEKQTVTVVTLPPSVLASLQDEKLPSLETLVVAGEACPLELVSRWAGRKRMINAYGPTEVTVCASMSSPLLAECASVSMGRALTNTQLFVLNEKLEPSPVGVPGELYIAGVGLSRGYLYQPDLTAERFLPNPFATEPGSRVYRTGDRVRHRPDGELEFLGRYDEQIKLRGFRIEVAEIEAALLRQPGIQQAATVLHDSSAGEKKLIGYVVREQDAVTDAGALRHKLYEILPDYMVPADIVVLPDMPLTVSGKIDRKKLREMPMASARNETTPPEDSVEAALLEIWKEVLEIENMGVEDDFFELGGHSLLTVKLMARVQEQFSVDLPLSTILKYPTVRRFSEALRPKSSAESVDSSIELIREGSSSQAPIYFIHPASGQVLRYHTWAEHLEGSSPVYALRDPLLAGGPRLKTVEELAEHYVNLISRDNAEAPYALAGWSFGGPLALEMARKLRERGKEVSMLMLIDPTIPGNGRAYEPLRMNVFLAMVALELNLPVSERDLQLEYSQFRQKVLEQWGAQTSEALARQLDHMVDMLQMRNESAGIYHAGVYPGRVHLMLAESSPTDAPIDHDSIIREWQSLLTGSLTTSIIPGNHYTLDRAANMAALARELNFALQNAQATLPAAQHAALS
ncbi:MAG TPA: amino acid adenylation domain-containing protein [Candidatus Angelobacter sp.]|nr:amino acid adenylation domain-containing protein [Candidatus Angelobacter sp.]